MTQRNSDGLNGNHIQTFANPLSTKAVAMTFDCEVDETDNISNDGDIALDELNVSGSDKVDFLDRARSNVGCCVELDDERVEEVKDGDESTEKVDLVESNNDEVGNADDDDDADGNAGC